MTPAFQQDLLDRYLADLFGDIGTPALELLRQHLQWVQIAGGATLMQQGEPGDAMYLLVSGRLRVYQRQPDGQDRVVRELGRGQSVGEMSLFTDEPRSATIAAIRDSVLVRLDKSAFHQVMSASTALSVLVTRQLIRRLQNRQPQPNLALPVVIALLPISAGVDLPTFASRLAEPLRRMARVAIVDAATVDQALQRPGAARAEIVPDANDLAIGAYLDSVEAEHQFVLLVGDTDASGWTQRCSRHCDEVLLVADARQPPVLHDIERQCLMPRAQQARRSEARETLILLHDAEQTSPQGTRQWLQRRPVAGHVHVRPTLARDMARLARLQAGTAVGLVLAGGGARGFAHLGVYRALQEHGIDVDWVGGTSIGAVMAAVVAIDGPMDQTMDTMRRVFRINPTGDFNLLPMISLIAGRRLRRAVDNTAREMIGHEGTIEDLWKNCYCVASNYTQAREQVLHQGALTHSLLASTAIPGALPPVPLNGDLLCDGGTFNNFPVDVMRGMRGVGRVIGVNLAARAPRPFEHDELPGAWALLLDRLRGRKRRRYRLPSLTAYLMNVSVLYSASRQREALRLTDLCFEPPLDRVGMLQWNRFDDIVRQGHAHATQVLQALPAEALQALGGRPATHTG